MRTHSSSGVGQWSEGPTFRKRTRPSGCWRRHTVTRPSYSHAADADHPACARRSAGGTGSGGGALRLEAEWEARRAPDADRRRLPLDLSVDGEATEPPGQDRKRLLQLGTSQRRAEAVVDPRPEGHLDRSAGTGDVEGVGPLEHLG